jgi:Lecithin:cholesterol acyltransferase
MNDVIVLLPGITGSELRKDGKVVWGWSGRVLAKNLFSGGKAIVQDLWGNSDSDTADDDESVTASRLLPDFHTLPGLWKIDGYGKVADYITRYFRLQEGANFVPFPYDWRRDNRIAARALKRRTDDMLHSWRRSSGNADAKLILIAHSMGGLVSRYFLEVLEGWRDTRALITFGTPYRGSLNAVDGLSNGIRLFNALDLTEFAQRLTALHQLLPIYPCIEGGDGNLKRVTEISVPNLSDTKARAALAFHDEIRMKVEEHQKDDAYRAHGYRTYSVVGVRQPTNQSASIVGNGVRLVQSYPGLAEDIEGDGTVPRVSAMPLEQTDAAAGMFAATKHASLQNADAVLAHLVSLIEGLYINLGVFKVAEARLTQLTLAIDDLYRLGEKITLRAKPLGVDVPLVTMIQDVETGAEFEPLQLRGASDDWKLAEFNAPRAGSYRVTVTSESPVEPVADVFEVV